jgi:hypothetical protein
MYVIKKNGKYLTKNYVWAGLLNRANLYLTRSLTQKDISNHGGEVVEVELVEKPISTDARKERS